VSNKFFQVRSYLTYWLDAVDEHSLHSPFFFDFYTKVVKKVSDPEKFHSIEKLRQKLLEQKTEITVKDFGSRKNLSPSRQVSVIASKSLSAASYSSLYFRIIQHFGASQVIELGTSLGINTLYLAEDKNVKVTTFEGDLSIAEIAKTTFEFANAKNIKLVQGELDLTLRDYLQTIRKIDVAFMDANHRYEPTMLYFERLLQKVHDKSVIIMDDIHYSQEMEKAWKAVQKHNLVYATADLYRCGIVFFDPSLNKQHVILQV
jgi:predicted O-methyltransferase YrrM